VLRLRVKRAVTASAEQIRHGGAFRVPGAPVEWVEPAALELR
jgi:hypothetical protein